MKRTITSLLIATQIGAATPLLSSANANEFKSDSVARRMLIEDAVAGTLNIKTVGNAYPYANDGSDLERAMWLALMKDPTLLEDYMSQGVGMEVKVAYPKGVLKTIGEGLYYVGSGAVFFSMLLFVGWMEQQPNNYKH